MRIFNAVKEGSDWVVDQVQDNSKALVRIGAGVGTGVASTSAFAVPVDLTTLTAGVDFSTTTAAILLVATALMGVYIAWKAAKLVIGAIKGM